MKRKVYISGKVTGDPDYKRKFKAAARKLRLMGFKPVNPTKGEPDGKPWAWYLRRDLRKLTKCSAILLLPDWAESKGASLEAVVAKDLGLDILVMNEFGGISRRK